LYFKEGVDVKIQEEILSIMVLSELENNFKFGDELSGTKSFLEKQIIKINHKKL